MKARWPLLLTLVGVIAWVAIVVITWAGAAPLGHDESQYAIAGREWIAGEGPRWFYLSRGMNVIAVPGIWLGASERALRLVPLIVGGLGFAAATWLVAKRSLGAASDDDDSHRVDRRIDGTHGPGVGLAAARDGTDGAGVGLAAARGGTDGAGVGLAAARGGTDGAGVGLAVGGVSLLVLAGARNVARYATDMLSDFPAAACLLLALAVLVDEVDRENGPRWRLLAAAPLMAAAMYVRYGSVVPIAVIVVASVIVGGKAIARRPGPLIATAGLFLALLVPHFVEAQRATGSPLGILLESREVPQQHYFAEGLRGYIASNPFLLYGALVPIPLLAGLASGFVSGLGWVRGRDRRRLMMWIVALGNLVAIGLTTHAQVRYVLISIALFTVLGVDQIRLWLGAVPQRARSIVVGGALAALAIAWGSLAYRHLATNENRTARMRGTLAAAAAIRADAHGKPCMVIGYHYTQLEWYSGCPAPIILNADFTSAAQRRGETVYVVRDFLPTWYDAPQPAYSEFPGTPVPILSTPKIVEVVRLTPP